VIQRLLVEVGEEADKSADAVEDTMWSAAGRADEEKETNGMTKKTRPISPMEKL
jgi:hypothetical protein